ncbi:MAG TPA: FMN-binding negative transcriptional regulator [Thermohalobaculum sp.]|nr:FMN-binding negative transcriptional regulator [Thermohalobaculum sp.]
MHPNPAFRHEPAERALATARERGFGVLTVASEAGVLAAHVPFVLDDAGTALEAHLVRSNPLARALRAGPADALLIVSGPDAYVSPDWYGDPAQVPTWNYVAVHLRGRLALRPDETLRPHLDLLSARFEERLPKPPWTTAKMPLDKMASMMRQIVPVAMTGIAVESTFKLNQNKPAHARAGAAAAIAAGGTPGMATAALAALMRGVPEG